IGLAFITDQLTVGLRDTKVAGSNYDGKQSKTDRTEQRAEEQQWQRGEGLQKRVERGFAGPIAPKQRKNERKQSNGYSVLIYCVSVGSSGTLEHSRALRLQERLQGRRPLVPMCRSIGEAVGISLEIYSAERKDAKVAATISALVGRSVLISLVPSVAEADVATVDGLESTIKSACDRKRWKLAAV
ncbi:hypothetical protein BHM03_00021394, partial [Ensete ventricosum]